MQTTVLTVHSDTFTSLELVYLLALSDTMPILHRDLVWPVPMIATPVIFKGIAFHATLLLTSGGYHLLQLDVSPWLVSSSRKTEQLEGCCKLEVEVERWCDALQTAVSAAPHRCALTVHPTTSCDLTLSAIPIVNPGISLTDPQGSALDVHMIAIPVK